MPIHKKSSSVSGMKTLQSNSTDKPPLRNPPPNPRSFSIESLLTSTNEDMWNKQIGQRGLESLEMYSFQLTNDRKHYCGTEASDKIYTKANIQKGEKVASHAEVTFISQTPNFIAYQNGTVPIGYGSVLIPPAHAAKIFDLAIPVLHSNSRILEIGTGSGFLTAGFAHLISYPSFQENLIGKNFLHEMLYHRAKYNNDTINNRQPMILSCDHCPNLIDRAKRHFSRKFPHFLKSLVTFENLDCRHPNFIPDISQQDKDLRTKLTLNWEVLKKNAPYDLIYIGCGLQSSRIPDEFLELLLIGGRCIAECGDTWDDQWLTVADRLPPPMAPEKIPIIKYEHNVPGINGSVGLALHKRTYNEAVERMKEYNDKIINAKTKYKLITDQLLQLSDQTTKQADSLRAQIHSLSYYANLDLLDHSNLPIISHQSNSQSIKKAPSPQLIDSDITPASTKTIYLSPALPGPLLNYSVKSSSNPSDSTIKIGAGIANSASTANPSFNTSTSCDSLHSLNSHASSQMNNIATSDHLRPTLPPSGSFISQNTDPIPPSNEASFDETWRGDEMALKMEFAPSESGQRLHEDPRVVPEFFFYPKGSDRQRALIGKIENIPITLQQIRAATLQDSEILPIDINEDIASLISSSVQDIRSERTINHSGANSPADANSPKHGRSRSNSTASNDSIGSTDSSSSNSDMRPRLHQSRSSNYRAGKPQKSTAYVNPMLSGSASSIHKSIPKPKAPKSHASEKPRIVASSSSRSRIASSKKRSNTLVNPLLSAMNTDTSSVTMPNSNEEEEAFQYSEESLDVIKSFDYTELLHESKPTTRETKVKTPVGPGEKLEVGPISVDRLWVDMFRIMPTDVPTMTGLDNQISFKIGSKYI